MVLLLWRDGFRGGVGRSNGEMANPAIPEPALQGCVTIGNVRDQIVTIRVLDGRIEGLVFRCASRVGQHPLAMAIRLGGFRRHGRAHQDLSGLLGHTNGDRVWGHTRGDRSRPR